MSPIAWCADVARFDDLRQATMADAASVVSHCVAALRNGADCWAMDPDGRIASCPLLVYKSQFSDGRLPEVPLLRVPTLYIHRLVCWTRMLDN
jgi:hypothetical protein